MNIDTFHLVTRASVFLLFVVLERVELEDLNQHLQDGALKLALEVVLSPEILLA